MRKITIADFKGTTFNPSAVIECASEYNIKDANKTLGEISDANFELDSLKEAIFFKKEKMKQSLSEQKEQMLANKCKELRQILGEVDIQEHAHTSEILQKRREQIELKTLSKIMKYSLSIQKNELQVLETLLNSEDTENWMLLAESIQVHINYSITDKTNFINYSKKLEEKITNIFQTSLNDSNITACKTCFDILATIDKEYGLIDTFLLSNHLLTTDINVYPHPITGIDLGLTTIENTTFDALLKNIINTLQTNYTFICQVFGLSDEYIEYIFTKISKTLISMNLSNFLNVSNSAIFILCLQTAYSNLQSFGRIIKILFPKIDFELNLIEIFSQFIYKSTLKEIQLFEEILEIYISGAKTLSTYTLCGVKITKTNNYIRICENMFVLIDSFLTRRDLFYSDENEVEVLKYCAKKLCILIDKIVSTGKDSWCILHDLFHIYSLNKKFFGEKFVLFESFNTKLVENTQQEFDNTIGMIKTFMKGEISNLFFNEEDLHLRLLAYLRKIYSKSKELGERNTKILFYKILDIIYTLLYNQIMHISFDKNRLFNISKSLDELSGYFAVNISSSLESKFDHLKLICELINSDLNQFKIIMSKNRAIFSEKEIRDIIKCRDDKGDKKDAILKNTPIQ